MQTKKEYQCGFTPTTFKEMREYYDFVLDQMERWRGFCHMKKARLQNRPEFALCKHHPNECVYARWVCEERVLDRVSRRFGEYTEQNLYKIITTMRAEKQRELTRVGTNDPS